MHFRCTFDQAARIAGLNKKKLSDDRCIMRREFGRDFLPTARIGQPLLCSMADCVALMLYADFRRDGYPVKVAGVIASHFRAAIREFPNADQLTAIKLSNGATFVRPTDDKRLEAEFRAGRHIATELTINIDDLRERVRRGAESRHPVEEAAHEVA